MNEKVIEDIKPHFLYFWKIVLDYGFVRASFKIAEMLKADKLGEFTGNVLIAWALVNKFYDGNRYSEAIWEEASQYLTREVEWMQQSPPPAPGSDPGEHSD